MGNQTHLDDFEETPGMQPSGYMHIDDIDLSQGVWYDLDDEPMANRPLKVNQSQKLTIHPALPSQKSSKYATNKTTQKNKAAQTNSSTAFHFFQQKNLFSVRTLLLMTIVISALVGGVAFAKAFTIPGITMPSLQQGAAPVSPTQPIPVQPTQGNPAHPTPSPTQPATMPTPSPTSILATATPLATTAPAAEEQSLPTDWVNSGRGMADLLEALSMASTFIQRYETIDYRSPATLTSSNFVMTKAALAHFQAQDKRSTPEFINRIQTERLVQAVFVTGTRLITTQIDNGRLFTWITVSYQLASQKGTTITTTTEMKEMTVLLVAAPFDTPHNAGPMGGLGQRVTSYATGETLPPIPQIP